MRLKWRTCTDNFLMCSEEKERRRGGEEERRRGGEEERRN